MLHLSCFIFKVCSDSVVSHVYVGPCICFHPTDYLICPTWLPVYLNPAPAISLCRIVLFLCYVHTFKQSLFDSLLCLTTLKFSTDSIQDCQHRHRLLFETEKVPLKHDGKNEPLIINAIAVLCCVHVT